MIDIRLAALMHLASMATVPGEDGAPVMSPIGWDFTIPLDVAPDPPPIPRGPAPVNRHQKRAEAAKARRGKG